MKIEVLHKKNDRVNWKKMKQESRLDILNFLLKTMKKDIPIAFETATGSNKKIYFVDELINNFAPYLSAGELKITLFVEEGDIAPKGNSKESILDTLNYLVEAIHKLGYIVFVYRSEDKKEIDDPNDLIKMFIKLLGQKEGAGPASFDLKELWGS